MDKKVNVNNVCKFLEANEGVTFTWKYLEKIFNCKISSNCRETIKNLLNVDGRTATTIYYEYPHGWRGEELTYPAIGFSLDMDTHYELDCYCDTKGNLLHDYAKMVQKMGLI